MLIQVVDDNRHVRQAIRSILEELDATIIESVGGEECLRQFVDQRPDVVLMDIRVQPVDGISTTRELHRCDPNACIVIVSQYDDADLRLAAARAGARGYVLKDDLLQLPETIRALRRM